MFSVILCNFNESLIESSCTQPAWDILLLYMKHPGLVLFYVSNLEAFRAQLVKEHAILL